MTPLKLAARVLPLNSAARMLIREEPDEMPMSEYCVKAGMWFKLLRKRPNKGAWTSTIIRKS